MEIIMNNFLTSIQPYLSFIKDIVTIISLSIAGCVAIKGLQTWRHQLKGTVNYELAKRLLKATYRLRDALQSVRNPFIPAAETRVAIKETHLDIKPTEEGFNAASTAAVYQLRWKPVFEAYQTLEVEAIEAEAVWGPEARAVTTALRKNINSLFVALDFYLKDMQSGGPRMLDQTIRETYERIVFNASAPDDDQYSKDLNSSVTAIEELARPHLIR
jgi:hypothetical protein